jgi:hypothetical protein
MINHALPVAALVDADGNGSEGRPAAIPGRREQKYLNESRCPVLVGPAGEDGAEQQMKTRMMWSLRKKWAARPRKLTSVGIRRNAMGYLMVPLFVALRLCGISVGVLCTGPAAGAGLKRRRVITPR